MRQLPLNITLRDDATFDNFYVGENEFVVNYLENPLEKIILLTGKKSSGLTHLLQAMCHNSKNCLYVPLLNPEIEPPILENLDRVDLVAIDDVDLIAGNSVWEKALFDLFNQRVQSLTKLIFSSHQSIASVKFQLPDLKSRLQSVLMFTVYALNDEEKLSALMLRAHNRGLTISESVGRYLLNHAPRDMAELFSLLDQLDVLSLQEKRRLSIPFIKRVLYNQ